MSPPGNPTKKPRHRALASGLVLWAAMIFASTWGVLMALFLWAADAGAAWKLKESGHLAVLVGGAVALSLGPWLAGFFVSRSARVALCLIAAFVLVAALVTDWGDRAISKPADGYGLVLVAALLSVVATMLSPPHRRRPHWACAQCGYDLRGLDGARCPECGWERPRPADQN